MKLGLGTVQFGLDYGVTNTAGRVPVKEVRRILYVAQATGIDLLDTAAQYGGSERVLGDVLPSDAPFRMVTKTPSFKTATIGAEQIEALSHTFRASLDNLNRQSLYACLFHHADDLSVPGGHALLEALLQKKAAGQVEKIGVSVYTGEQIDRVLDLFLPDIVQLPLNVLDQRLIASGHLARLKRLGVEIHARSVFLQGVLLNPMQAPPWLREALRDYAVWLSDRRLSPLEAALSFAAGIPEIDYLLVGVCSAAQLREIPEALQRAARYDFSRFACPDEHLVNPARWPQLSGVNAHST